MQNMEATSMSTPAVELPSLSEVMLPLGRFPALPRTALFKEVLDSMADDRLGIVCVVDEDNRLAGVFTDGDLRRKLLRVQKPFSAFFADDISEHMTTSPLSVTQSTALREAVELMEARQVWDLPVVDDDGILKGLVHLHPVVKALLEAAG